MGTMQNTTYAQNGNPVQAIFDRYPWAANHNEAIACITRYMDSNVESIIQQLDQRILNKVAKDNFLMTSAVSFT